MKLIVAVSGGVDSVVLLDMLVRAGQDGLVVAHFDHGIRDDSAADARFVEGLAVSYGLSFEMRREELGQLPARNWHEHGAMRFYKKSQTSTAHRLRRRIT